MSELLLVKDYVIRITKLIWGLFLYAAGIYLAVQAAIGLAPWDVFAQGLALVAGVSLGTMTVLSGVAILVLVVILKEKIGIGTILNTILIGVFLDMLLWLDLVPTSDNFIVSLVMLLLGQVVISFGSYFYIGAGLGCGPRDSLMVALGKRLPKLPIGVVRGALEGLVLLIGWLLGGTVGLGTVIAAFGIGAIIQGVFTLMKFNVTAVAHESVIATGKKPNKP